MTELAVIIVTWNNANDIGAALSSLYAELQHIALPTEVVVVDSASGDDTAALIAASFPQVTLLKQVENVGFARGNNIGISYLQANGGVPEFVYLLNPDTITQPGAVRALIEALEADARVGVAGARLTFGDGTFQHSAFAFPGLFQLWADVLPVPARLLESRLNGRYPREQYAGEEPFDVDFVLGATMMMRGEVITQTGMFDEAYFMYCEEVDWQWRIRRAGWRIVCVPAAHVVHLGGQSSGQAKPQSTRHLWESRLRMYARYYSPYRLWLARQMVRAGMWWRLRHTTDPEMRAVYADIMAQASS